MSWIHRNRGRLELSLRVVPRASRNEVAGILGDVLKIRLQAPPVEGKANQALIKFLSERLSLPARNIELLQGDSARLKRIAVTGLAEEDVRARMLPAGSPGA